MYIYVGTYVHTYLCTYALSTHTYIRMRCDKCKDRMMWGRIIDRTYRKERKKPRAPFVTTLSRKWFEPSTRLSADPVRSRGFIDKSIAIYGYVYCFTRTFLKIQRGWGIIYYSPFKFLREYLDYSRSTIELRERSETFRSGSSCWRALTDRNESFD